MNLQSVLLRDPLPFCCTLYLIKHRALNMYSSMHSLTSALGGGEWSASRPGRSTPRESDPGTHWIGGWAGPSAGLDTVSKTKIPIPRRDSNPNYPIVQPVVSRYKSFSCKQENVNDDFYFTK
jgi:hypothetical protein